MTVTAVRAPGIDEIAAAADRIASYVTPLPLVRLLHDHGDREIYLQLENLQPVGCYKLRGAANAMLRLGRDVLDRGLYVASAGNLAQGCAWMARELGTSLRVLVPQDAPETKLAAVRRLGGEVVRVPFPEWWQTMITGGHPAESGHFIHGVFDSDVIAGHGTIGLEIAERLPSVDEVFVPFGGGAMALGIAVALSARAPQARVIAAEVETGAPFHAALAAGAPVEVAYRRSFVDGIGSPRVLDPMWPALSGRVRGSSVVSLSAIEDAIRLLAERHHVIAEGAGAASVAAALQAPPGTRAVAVVSGGHINASELCRILGAASA